MAYVTGSASAMSDVKTAIETAAVAAGWTLTSGILSKSGCFFGLTISGTIGTNQRILLQGGTSQTGSTLNGQPTSNYGICMQEHSSDGHVFTWPLTYHIFTFTNPDEIYCVIQYGSGFYQEIAFGKTDVPGIGGTGAFFTGSCGSQYTWTPNGQFSITYNGFSASNGCLFETYNNGAITLYVNWSGGVTNGWNNYGGSNYIFKTHRHIGTLLGMLPNTLNGTTMLLPVKVTSDVSTPVGAPQIILKPKNYRALRNDNLANGQVITIGGVQWKTFPHFAKNTASRTGGAGLHSGTFGFALRYEP